MKACVYGGSKCILVNGSPTEEICIQKGLKQGDILAPIFIGEEGFSGFMRNVCSLNLFFGVFILVLKMWWFLIFNIPMACFV